MKPNKESFNEYFHYYVDLVDNNNLLNAFEDNTSLIIDTIGHLNENESNYRYAEGKWSIKELLIHLIDTETVFNYRALAIARGDKTPLPGYDYNVYVDNCNVSNCKFMQLLKMYTTQRNYTKMLYKGFNEQTLNNAGTVSNKPLTVKAIGFLTLGHEIHHMNVIKERYLEAFIG